MDHRPVTALVVETHSVICCGEKSQLRPQNNMNLRSMIYLKALEMASCRIRLKAHIVCSQNIRFLQIRDSSLCVLECRLSVNGANVFVQTVGALFDLILIQFVSRLIAICFDGT